MSGYVVRNNNTQQFLSELNRAIEKSLEESGAEVENHAAYICPVDTGKLRNSLTHRLVDDRTCEVGTDTEYALYVEAGTSRAKAQPYLVPSLKFCAPLIEQIFRNNLS